MFTLLTVGTGEAWYLMAMETALHNDSFTWVFILYWFLGCIITINICAGIIVDSIIAVQQEKQVRRAHFEYMRNAEKLASIFLMFEPDDSMCITRTQCLEGLRSAMIQDELRDVS